MIHRDVENDTAADVALVHLAEAASLQDLNWRGKKLAWLAIALAENWRGD